LGKKVHGFLKKEGFAKKKIFFELHGPLFSKKIKKFTVVLAVFEKCVYKMCTKNKKLFTFVKFCTKFLL